MSSAGPTAQHRVMQAWQTTLQSSSHVLDLDVMATQQPTFPTQGPDQGVGYGVVLADVPTSWQIPRPALSLMREGIYSCHPSCSTGSGTTCSNVVPIIISDASSTVLTQAVEDQQTFVSHTAEEVCPPLA
jgi:hypothetical protein